MRNRQLAVRKAAILIASLDPPTAEGLLDQMPLEQASAVRAAIDALGNVSPKEQQATIEEFFRIGPLVPEKSPPGIELDGNAIDEWLPSIALPPAEEPAPIESSRTAFSPSTHWSWPAEASSFSADTRRAPSEPFRFLADTSSDALARYLEREHPQTVAVVLSHLTSDRAADVLALLPAQFQGEVTLRLVHLDDTHPEVLADIERGMQSWMREQSQALRRRTAGLATLRGILAASNDRAKQKILHALALRDRRLADKLAAAPRRTLSFADVQRLDDPTLESLLRQAPEELLLLALLGAAEPLVPRVLELLPTEQARNLQERMENLGPTRLSDVEQAQHELAELATRIVASRAGNPTDSKRLSVAV
ncbi:MAG TPA: FliG C-terminal domain-containing protein [Pirellulales bacterium]|jgi:flagellar motor switch protein FliG|nr:FliG C-terminal domain-containing protein [Pirellulales bacterium]